jgi:hypothetical protein
MKKSILKYGYISSLIVVGVPVITSMILGFGAESFGKGEIIGYASMVVAMGTVYFAMRHYRDEVNQGDMSFEQGLKIGSLISVMAGLAFAAYNLVFVVWIMPDFNEQYFAYSTGLEVGSVEFKSQYDTMMAENGFMFSVTGGTLLMFLTVFLIGFIESVVSALIVKRKSVLTTG